MEKFRRYWPFVRGIHWSTVGEFPAQRPVTRRFDVFFDLRLNKTLSKQRWGWWFETPSRPLWRHCSVIKLSCGNGNKWKSMTIWMIPLHVKSHQISFVHSFIRIQRIRLIFNTKHGGRSIVFHAKYYKYLLWQSMLKKHISRIHSMKKHPLLTAYIMESAVKFHYDAISPTKAII